MMLLNLAGHMSGVLFVDEYSNFGLSFHFFESLLLISLYSIIQIFVFPINKKYRVFVIPLLTLLLFTFIVFSHDSDGFGGEIVHNIVALGSKIIYLIYFIIAYNIENESTRIIAVDLLQSVGYSMYLFAVFVLCKYLMKIPGKKSSRLNAD